MIRYSTTFTGIRYVRYLQEGWPICTGIVMLRRDCVYCNVSNLADCARSLAQSLTRSIAHSLTLPACIRSVPICINTVPIGKHTCVKEGKEASKRKQPGDLFFPSLLLSFL